MTKKHSTILTHQDIKHKIRRIAYQIYESNVDETELILAGIADNGYILAKKLKIELNIIIKMITLINRLF